MHIRFILVETSLPANIGASARALKVMGFNDLRLVSPLCDAQHADATALASGATDVLQNIQTHTNVLDAIKDCHWVMGLTARDREFSPINISSKAVKAYLETAKLNIRKPTCAIILGNERRGLTHDQLMHCSHRVFIPANPSYSSLNVAQALQIMAYELQDFSPALNANILNHQISTNDATLILGQSISQDLLLAMHQHVLEALQAIDYYDGYSKLPEKLLQFWQKYPLTQEEMNIWRGIAKAILIKSNKN